MSLVFSFAKSLLSQKLRERFLTHSDFEHLWKVVPQNILPGDSVVKLFLFVTDASEK
jgi:hypothetical protein